MQDRPALTFRVRAQVSEPLDLLGDVDELIIEGDVDLDRSDELTLVIDVRPPVGVVGSSVGWLKVQPRYVGESFERLSDEWVTVAGEMRSSAEGAEAMQFIGAVRMA